jgi:phospholipid/cholesterol/gamma-HCH transport system substrate-binding protein
VLPRRIYVNLGAFVVLFVILMVWAVLGIIRPAALQDTYPLRLEFVDATGLRPGVEATYRGVRVGEVIEVSLADGGADVRLAVDADRRLPAGATAAIRRRSAVGEPYVSLDAPEGWESGDAMLAAGDEAVIPAERTSTGVAYGTLFDAAEELLVSVDKDDLRTLTAELGTALRGQGDELRRILRNTSDTASSFAERKDELDQLAGELTALTRLLADKSTTIADSTDDVSALVGSLASSADDIDTLLARTPAVASRLDELLVAAYGDLRCTAAGAASISNVIDTEHTLRQITRLLRSAETAAVVIPKAIFDGPDGRYLSGTFGFAPGEFAEYPDFPQFAPTEDVAPCPGGAPAGPGGLVDAPVSSVSPDSDGTDGEGDDDGDGDGDDAARRLTSTEGNEDGGIGLLPALVGALIAAAIATAAVAALRNRRKDLTP